MYINTWLPNQNSDNIELKELNTKTAVLNVMKSQTVCLIIHGYILATLRENDAEVASGDHQSVRARTRLTASNIVE